MPFPVHVVSRVVKKDDIALTTHTTKYAYHDGYYDGHKREFRGFGMVDQWDTETYSLGTGKPYRKPTCHTKLWFHTSAQETGLTTPCTFGEPYLESGAED